MEEPVLALLTQPSDATELNVQVIIIRLANLSEHQSPIVQMKIGDDIKSLHNNVDFQIKV